MFSSSKSKAFTIIELLVVIVIIAVLATLATIMLSNARTKARDARRLADMKQLQTALDMYYSDQGYYPSTLTPDTSLKSPDNLTTYMSQIPKNPVSADGNCPANTDYTYQTQGSNISFTIVFCLGGANNSISAGTNTATPAGILAGCTSNCTGKCAGESNGCGGVCNCNTTTDVCVSGSCVACGTATVTYEGGPSSGNYNTVLIGSQCWLKQNLNVGVRVNSTTSGYCELNLTNNSIVEKYCYDNTDSNCTTYGGLYHWQEAMKYVSTEGTQGICPTGWHIPTDTELTTLTQNYESANAGLMLQSTSGFNGLNGGYRGYCGGFSGQGSQGWLLSSTGSSFTYTGYYTSGEANWYRTFWTTQNNVGRYNQMQSYGASVRCLKN